MYVSLKAIRLNRMNAQFIHQQYDIKCPACGRKFSQPDLSLFQERLQGNVYHATCSICCSSFFIVEVTNPFGTMHMGTPTDIVSQDIPVFSQEPPIELDEVLDAYEFFKQYQGGTYSLVEM